MRAHRVPDDATGLRRIPDRAKTVTMKSEMTESGENCGPIFIDGKKLEGRWFKESEARSLAKSLRAAFRPDPALSDVKST